VHVEIVETIPKARREGGVRVLRKERNLPGVVASEIFDDDARLGNDAAACVVDEHGKLHERPELREISARHGVREIDEVRLERRVVFVKRDENLPASGSERMVVERQRHGSNLLMGEKRAAGDEGYVAPRFSCESSVLGPGRRNPADFGLSSVP
jgi:hypothetical protein